jgi:hypothetical protein
LAQLRIRAGGSCCNAFCSASVSGIRSPVSSLTARHSSLCLRHPWRVGTDGALLRSQRGSLRMGLLWTMRARRVRGPSWPASYLSIGHFLVNLLCAFSSAAEQPAYPSNAQKIVYLIHLRPKGTRITARRLQAVGDYPARADFSDHNRREMHPPPGRTLDPPTRPLMSGSANHARR